MKRLESILRRIDSRGFKAYRDLTGPFYLPRGIELSFHSIQSDPFAPPSRLGCVIPRDNFRMRSRWPGSRLEKRVMGDFITRLISGLLGPRGPLGIARPGQEILERNSVVIDDERLEIRLTVELPAAGRRILGRKCATLLTDVVPGILDKASDLRPHADNLEGEMKAARMQVEMRDALEGMGLVSFVGDGSLLPRRSGVDDRPMTRGARPFASPPGLRVEMNTSAGAVTGMGIPKGVTLITGGGYHGKSTLLSAIARGVYDHIPGDGREAVVTLWTAVPVRAEDGRRITNVDISPFLSDLPGGSDTRNFTSDDASGSTSEAAAIIEAIEAGSGLILLDEDTSATNFMIRDARMQALVSKDSEPITPFIDRCRELVGEGLSTVMVTGGSGDYLDVADTVIGMKEYEPFDLTAEAGRIASLMPSGRRPENPGPFKPRLARYPDPNSIDPRRGRKETAIRIRGSHRLSFGREELDLSALTLLVDDGQTSAVGRALVLLKREFERGASVAEALEEYERVINDRGLDGLPGRKTGSLSLPRRFEVAAALSRLRSLAAD